MHNLGLANLICKTDGNPNTRLVGYKKDGDRLFSRVCGDQTRGYGFKLKEGRFKFDIWKKSFTLSMVKHWNRLSSDVIDAPSMETCKASLD